jgi:hypothetical protein
LLAEDPAGGYWDRHRPDHDFARGSLAALAAAALSWALRRATGPERLLLALAGSCSCSRA